MEKYYISSNKYSLQERVTKKHGKVYDVVFRITTLNGEEKQKRLSGYSSKTLAKMAYMDFVQENCQLLKNNPLKKKDAEKHDLIVKDLVVQYFQSLPNQLKDATIYEKQKLFNLIILPRFGDMKIKHITKEELYLWQDELWAKKNPKTGAYYSWKYLSKIRTYFSDFLSWCSMRYGTQNYLLEVQKPKRRLPQKKMQIWTREEFDLFLSNITNPTYKAFFATLFFTGRRKGEVQALTNADVDLVKGTIVFDKSLTRKTLDGNPYNITSTKTEIATATPICEPLKEILKEYKSEGTFYFGGDEPLTDNTIRRAFDKYAELAGLHKIRIHDLRHSFVSMCIHLSATIPVVADLIGDTITQVTKTYAHLYETDKKEIISRII